MYFIRAKVSREYGFRLLYLMYIVMKLHSVVLGLNWCRDWSGVGGDSILVGFRDSGSEGGFVAVRMSAMDR